MTNKFKEILKHHKVKGKEIAKELELTYGSFRAAIVQGANTPKWVKAFHIGYRLGKNEKQ